MRLPFPGAMGRLYGPGSFHHPHPNLNMHPISIAPQSSHSPQSNEDRRISSVSRCGVSPDPSSPHSPRSPRNAGHIPTAPIDFTTTHSPGSRHPLRSSTPVNDKHSDRASNADSLSPTGTHDGSINGEAKSHGHLYDSAPSPPEKTIPHPALSIPAMTASATGFHPMSGMHGAGMRPGIPHHAAAAAAAAAMNMSHMDYARLWAPWMASGMAFFNPYAAAGMMPRSGQLPLPGAGQIPVYPETNPAGIATE